MDHDFLPERHLPYRVTTGPGVRWWLADEAWEPWAASADDMVRTRRVPPQSTLLKQGPNRLIVRLPRPEGLTEGPASAVVKAFPMQRVRQALFRRYRRYGPTELANMEMARERGLPVPLVHGYAERRLCGLMVTNTAVMMEDLSATRSVRDVLASPTSPAERDAALVQARSLLLKLYAAGCNHIDLNSGNILLPVDGRSEARIIDFMYTRFHPAPSLNTFCFMVAYFADSVASLLAEDTLGAWCAAS